MHDGKRGPRFPAVLVAVLCGVTVGSAQTGVPLVDPNLQPVQRLQPPVAPATIPDAPDRTPSGTTVPTGIATSPARGSAPVVDPPPPQVQLQLRTPSHVPVGKPVPYTLKVVNASQSKALRVKVRMPFPDGAAALTKCEPKAAGVKELPVGPPSELVWDVGNLNRGEEKVYELEFTPQPGGKLVTATAYVSFEYGARVETVIDQPKVTVKKTATPTVAVGELATVRVEVTNTGKVPVPNAVLKEFAPDHAEVRGDGDAEKTNLPGQRAWKLNTLAPGQTKTVTYQLLFKRDGEFTTASFVDCETGRLGAADTPAATAATKVQKAALALEFTGPAAVTGRNGAEYVAVVKNVGSMAMENVRVAVEVPDDLAVVKLTNGCRTDRGLRVWVVPKLAAGESQGFRLAVEPEQGVSGKRTLKATARDGRGRLDAQTKDVTTEYVGRADLTWKPSFDPVRVDIGRQGTLRVAVRNQGSETDKGVSLRVMLPPEVQPVGSTPPNATLDQNTFVFPPQSLAPGKAIEFTVTYEGKKAGQARFGLLLEAQSLGEKGLRKDQTVEIGR
jgi:hypothetical protein